MAASTAAALSFANLAASRSSSLSSAKPFRANISGAAKIDAPFTLRSCDGLQSDKQFTCNPLNKLRTGTYGAYGHERKVERSSTEIEAAVADFVTQEDVAVTTLPRGDTWSVHKFGGTCVGTWERIWNVSGIIVDDPSLRKLVVVSAMSKVTDNMYSLVDKAQRKDNSYEADLVQVYEKHRESALSLLSEGSDLDNFLDTLQTDVQNLQAILRAVYIGTTLLLALLPLLHIYFTGSKES